MTTDENEQEGTAAPDAAPPPAPEPVAETPMASDAEPAADAAIESDAELITEAPVAESEPTVEVASASAPVGDRPPSDRPPADRSFSDRSPRRDAPDSDERPRRRHFGRRRVCMFCADKVKSIDYKDAMRLRRFLSDRARVEPRRKTGTCAKHQRWLATALKRARHLAMLPYTPEHIRLSGVTTGRQR